MSVLHQQIGAWLGIPIPKTDQQVLEIVERQLPPPPSIAWSLSASPGGKSMPW